MKRNIYSNRELSAFCLQISLLLKAGVPLDEGLLVMAEDAGTEPEKKMLMFLSEEIETGEPFFAALEKTGAFPHYIVRMAKLGQQTGTTDQMMEALAVYYEKEYFMMCNIRNVLTYPLMMVFMLLVVLFVLFVKVMPVFERIYEQLGAQISPVSKAAMQLGGIFSGVALAAGTLVALVTVSIYLISRTGRTVPVAEKLVNQVKRRNRIALSAAKRRFTAIIALTLKSGLELEKGLELAHELVENSRVAEQIAVCKRQLEDGRNYYEALKSTGLFSGFHIQMIKVGNRSGHLDQVMEQLSEEYEMQSDVAIDTIISRFEPTLVAILAVTSGMILLSVMLPLAGALSAIG